MKKAIHLLFLLSLATSCRNNEFIDRNDENILPAYVTEFEAALNLPPIFPEYNRPLPFYLQSLGMAVKPVDNGKATLGRVLFYDKNLSLDRSTSCASCHKQDRAFSDDVAFSRGINGLMGSRNSMPIANVASFSAHYSEIGGLRPLLLWDSRAANVAEQSKLAFLNDHEIGMTMEGVANRIKEQAYYPYLWQKIYGNFEVTESQVLECLSEFVGSIGAADSRFDRALEAAKGEIGQTQLDTLSNQEILTAIYNGDTITFPNGSGTGTVIETGGLLGFTTEENHGRDIFVANCSKCHSPIRSFQEVFEACNGLEMVYPDQGRGKLTGNTKDNGVFKAPSLRNIALTGPYMHDGRFKTLEEVVNFYSDNVVQHPNLHPKMLHNGDPNLHLSAQEKKELVAFLNTLTDNKIEADNRFSNPFRQ